MSYPKWLEKAGEWDWCPTKDCSVCKENLDRAVQMAKDAWDILHNHGIDGGMPPEEFCAKYEDHPKTLPYIAFDHPNDGARL